MFFFSRIKKFKKNSGAGFCLGGLQLPPLAVLFCHPCGGRSNQSGQCSKLQLLKWQQWNCSTEEGCLLRCVIPGDSRGGCKEDFSLSHDQGKAVGVGGKGILVSTKVFLENGTIQAVYGCIGWDTVDLNWGSNWDGERNTLRNSWTRLIHPLWSRQNRSMMEDQYHFCGRRSLS